MALGNIPLLAQTTVYSLTLLLSFAALIPMAWHVSNFKGQCLLYTKGTFDTRDGHFIPDWASPLYCWFSMIASGLAVLISVCQLCKFSYLLYKGRDSSFLGAFFDCVMSVGMTTFVLTSSVFVSDGFRTWCGAMEQRFPSCEEPSVTEIDPADGITTLDFYVMIGTAQFAQWTAWVCWILQSVLSIRKLCIYHERENIIMSMARERRLLNASQRAYSMIMQNNPDESNLTTKDSDTVPILE